MYVGKKYRELGICEEIEGMWICKRGEMILLG